MSSFSSSLEDLGLLFELELLDLFFEFVEILPLVELHIRFELLDLVEQLVGFGVELVAVFLVFLDLFVELVALFAVLLGFVDLLASLRVEIVAFGSALGSHLVQLVSPVSQLTGHLDELPFRFVLQVVLCQFDVFDSSTMLLKPLCHTRTGEPV